MQSSSTGLQGTFDALSSILGKGTMIVIASGLFAVGILLLLFYLWHALRELVVILKNYNFRRANYCNWSSCGLFFHDVKDPSSKDCLNPFVPYPYFEKLSRSGNQKGCRRSMQVREIDIPRRPAEDYEEEYLMMVSTFGTSRIWKDAITIILGILLLMFGVLSLWRR